MFRFYMPTEILAGKNCVKDNAPKLVLGNRAMIVTGKSSGRKSGALKDVTDVLNGYGTEYLIYDKIGNNPTIEETVEGGRAAREFGADFLIGIGGGSPLDAAKAIAVYAVNEPCADFDVYDIFNGTYKNKPLPMTAIPTTAGTGSEATPYSILTLNKIKNKKSFASDDVFYKTAFLDGRYTVNLPLQIARNTAVDTLCHLLEGFTNTRSNCGSDYIALEGLRILGKHLDKLKKGGMDEDVCTELLWASCLGGNVISQTGTTIVHSMGYPLTYYKNIAHGMANGLLLGEYLLRTKPKLPEKTTAYLKALGMSSIDELSKLIHELEPCDILFTKSELDEWTKTTIQAKNVSVCPFDITREVEMDIYEKALL